MRIVVLGAGQLGSALWRVGAPDVVLLEREQLDITSIESIERVLPALAPSAVINAAAYNRVDEAESKPGSAFSINAIGPAYLARVSARLGARFVHFSTDYVFSGQRSRPYVETDETGPLGIYAASKLAGEHLARAYVPEALIVRTSAVFGSRLDGRDNNFVLAILRRLRSGGTVQMVADKTAAPTYAEDLARTTLALLDRGVTGTIHVTNAGFCTWVEFAQAIAADGGLEPRIVPIATASSGDVARRPLYSVMDLGRLESTGLRMPPWREALRRYLASMPGYAEGELT